VTIERAGRAQEYKIQAIHNVNRTLAALIEGVIPAAKEAETTTTPAVAAICTRR
jgi:hypothetical protein